MTQICGVVAIPRFPQGSGNGRGDHDKAFRGTTASDIVGHPRRKASGLRCTTHNDGHSFILDLPRSLDAVP